MDNSEERKQLIEQLEGLPTLPTIMVKIFECIDDPKSSAEDLKKIIINDLAISSKVLKLANSAYFGFSREIVDITRAIVVLGFDTVIDVAVSVSLASLMNPKEGSLVLPMEQFWEHNIAAGQAGRIIAQAGNYPYQEQAFLVGLMHDIGKAILASNFTREFNRAVENAQDLEQYIHETERDIFGFSHAEAGAWLAKYWKFPKQLIMPIQFHHSVTQMPAEFSVEICIAHSANYLAKKTGIGSSGDENKLYDIEPEVFRVLSLNQQKFEELEEELSGKKELINSFVEAIL